MATVVNNADRPMRDTTTGTGWIVAIVILLALVLLFLFGGAFVAGRGGGASSPAGAVENGIERVGEGVQGTFNAAGSGSVDVSGGASGQ